MSKRVDDPQGRVPTGDDAQQPFTAPGQFEVKLPGGGVVDLGSAAEKEMWTETSRRYVRDYHLTRTNDLILLGAILSQVLVMYRAQRDLVDEKKGAGAQAMITKSASEIGRLEKALGIDKATREKGGQMTVRDYLVRLKRAGHAKGTRISERVKEYERVMMEARWKIRVLRNGDAEDLQYHRLTPQTFIDWLEKELGAIEENDKKWAKEQGAIWIGKL